jgi:4-amino-4-deoxy-L-arabinose transferase-like glycosyltransferase
MIRTRAPSPVWLLVPLLPVAAVLRFAGLSTRGLLYWDEGKFALEGLRLLAVMHALPSVHAGALPGKAVGTAKPTHALLIAAAYAVLGVHAFAPLYMDALAGVASVALLYFLASSLFGARTALLAALFLTVSSYDLVYARSALSESDANLLFLAGVLVWWTGYRRAPRSLRRQCRYNAATGLLLGTAFTANYRLIVYIAVLAMLIAGLGWRRDGPRRTAIACLIGAAGLITVPLLWEMIGLAARLHGITVFRSEITYRPTTYLAEALYQLHGGKQAALHFDPGLYLQWYLALQGPLFCLLLPVGLIAAAVRRTVPLLLCAVLVVIPFALYSFAPFIVPRNLEAMIPFTAVLSAAGLCEIVDRVTRAARVLAPVLALAVAGFALLAALPLLGVRSGFARAAAYIDRHPTAGAMVDDEVMVFYLRDRGSSCDGARLPRHLRGLASGFHAGDAYAVVAQDNSPSVTYLAQHARRVARFSALGAGRLGENLIAGENGLPPSSNASRWIDVYALRGLHLPRHTKTRPVTCSQDRLP